MSGARIWLRSGKVIDSPEPPATILGYITEIPQGSMHAVLALSTPGGPVYVMLSAVEAVTPA